MHSLRCERAHLIWKMAVARQVPSVLFVPSKGVALIPLQIQTALVVDTGYHDTRVLPVRAQDASCACRHECAGVCMVTLNEHLVCVCVCVCV
jgi:hypothetical protein